MEESNGTNQTMHVSIVSTRWILFTVARAKRDSPASIRGRFGLCDTQNSVHGSDSIENALKEINFMFPEFCCNEWLRNLK